MGLLICWDLDETLGDFRGVGDRVVARLMASWEAQGLADAMRDFARDLASAPAVPVALRPGIADLLAELRRDGFTQVVTTQAFREYALLGLEEAGLLGHLDAVHARETLWNGHSKRYRMVMEAHGATPHETLIITNDFETDRCDDPWDVVVVHEPVGLKKPAALLGPVVRGLADVQGFRAGFDRLVARAEPRGLMRCVDLGGVSACVDFWGDYAQGRLTPVVSRITASG